MSWLRNRALGLAKTAALIVLFTLSSFPALAGPSVWVYLPASVKARALQTSLSEAMPGVEVTVYGRIRDLETALAAGKPDAVLSLRPVLETRGLAVDLQGFRGSQSTEVYVAVSTKDLTPAELAEKVVGSVDLLGRSHMERFVAVLVGSATAPQVKRVQESGDLLPLLQFEAADAVLLPEDAVQALVASSQMDLKIVKLDKAQVGLAAVSFPPGADRAAVEAAIKNLPADARAKLGIDRWGN